MIVNDLQKGVEMAWHKNTQIRTSEQLAAEGFGFDYLKAKVSANGQEVPDWYWLQGSDDKRLVGNPQYKSFGFLSNEKLMEIVRETLKGTGGKSFAISSATIA